jgi:hypothetical protein
MIALCDVKAGSRWFQEVLGLRPGQGSPEQEVLLDNDQAVLQLHRWDADDHPYLGDESHPSRGNGVLLWFATEDFDGLVARVVATKAKVLDGPLYDPKERRWEIWLEGPEGYRVVVASPQDY